MSFTSVSLDAPYEEPRLLSTQHGIFDVRSSASIFRDVVEEEQGSPKRPRLDTITIIADANEKQLLLAAEESVSLFQLDPKMKSLSSTTIDEASIIGACVLDDSQLAMVVTSNGIVMIYSMAEKASLIQMDFSDDRQWCKCPVQCIVQNDVATVFGQSDTGMAFRFDLRNFSAMKSLNTGPELVEYVQQSGSTHKNEKLKETFAHFILLSHGSIVGVTVKGSLMEVTRPVRGIMRVIEYAKGCDKGYYRIHISACGSFLFCLTTNNTLDIVDVFTMTTMVSHCIPSSASERFIDFAFVEWPEATLSQSRIALIVEKGTSTEVQVRPMDSLGEVSFAFESVPGAQFVESGCGKNTDRLALIVEPPVAEAAYNAQCIRVREVLESQPEQRLSRLLQRGLIDEAEAFALKYNLDMRRVHLARASNLLNRMEDQCDDALLRAFMAALEKVDDTAEVGDFCITASSFVTDGAKICRLLEYAESRKISDPSTLEQLYTYSYNFASYRMIFGPDASFDKESTWSTFHDSTAWIELWENFMAVGLLMEARVIWHRYPHVIVPTVSPNVFAVFDKLLTNRYSKWRLAVDCLEAEIVPALLSSTDNQKVVMQMFSNVLKKLASHLEMADPELFPENALYAVAAVDRLVSRLSSQSLTPLKAAEFLFNASQCAETVEDMQRMVRDLQAIKVLKEKYECPLTYQKYKSLSTQEVCHEILQRSVQNPEKVRDRIDRIARPYMVEHFLPADQTLLGHIQKVSHIARSSTATDAFDVHCLLVTEAIESPSVRARAVQLVAEKARLPWCGRLSKAVEAVLADDKINAVLKQELRTTCDRSELAIILQKYSLDREYLSSVIESEFSFTNFVHFLLTNSSVSNEVERFTSTAKAVEIYRRMCPSASIDGMIGLDKRIHALQLVNEEKLSSLHSFVMEHSIVDDVISSLILREESAVTDVNRNVDDEETITRRSRQIRALCSLIQRHKQQDETLQSLHKELKRVLKCLEEYCTWTNHIKLRDGHLRKYLLTDYITRKARTPHETVACAMVLGMDEDEMCCALLDYSLPCLEEKKSKKNEREPDLDSAIGVAKMAMKMGGCTSKKVLIKTDHVCRQLLYRISKLRDTPNQEECDAAIYYITTLEELLTKLLHRDEELTVTEGVLKMLQWIGLARATLDQITEGPGTTPNTPVETQSDKAIASLSMKSVNEEDNYFPALTRRRVGLYEPKQDGIIYQSRISDAIYGISSIACSFIPNVAYGDPSCGVDAMEMDTRWTNLINFFNEEGQNLLEMRARVVAKVVGCSDDNGVYNFVMGMEERLLSAHPADLPLAATLITMLDMKDTMKMLLKLLNWTSTRRSPQTALNGCRLTQLFVERSPPGNDRTGKLSQLGIYFKKHLWEKVLGKRNIAAHQDGSKAIVEFAKVAMEPEIVREYLSDLPECKLPEDWLESRESKNPDDIIAQRISIGMKHYVILLIENSTRTSSPDERDNLLLTADLTIQVESKLQKNSQLSESLYYSLEKTLQDCCPYAYETIIFILVHMETLAPEKARENNIDKMKLIVRLLSNNNRTKHVTKEERTWYTERETAKASGFNVTFSAETDMNATMDGGRRLLTMPANSVGRLPFHLLLEQKDAPVGLYVVPVIWNEIAIENLKIWYDVIHSIPWLTPSKSESESPKHNLRRAVLLTKAVMKKVNEVRGKDEKLSDCDAEVIEKNLSEEKGKHSMPLLYRFSMEMKHQPLSETKIQLLTMGHNVTQKWLAGDIENAKDRKDIVDHMGRLKEVLCLNKTRMLLLKHGLLNDETKQYEDDPSNLISYLYDKTTWDDPMDVEKKCALIEKLAEVNEHDMSVTHSTLVGNWLVGDNGRERETAADVDLNDTMGGSGSYSPFSIGRGHDSDGDEKATMVIPFFETAVNRIVHILRLRSGKSDNTLHTILNMANNLDGTAPGGYATSVRAICVLLRAFNREALGLLAPNEDDDVVEILSSRLENMLYKRLVQMSIGNDKMEAFEKAKETGMSKFVKSLMNDGSTRSKPHIVHLATCLTTDFLTNEEEEQIDPKILETLLSKLLSERKFDMLTMLLKFCRDNEGLRKTRKLDSLWGRTMDWALREKMGDNKSPSVMHDWLLFALSCPVQCGQTLETTRTELVRMGALVAAYLLERAAHYCRVSTRLNLENRNLELDTPCEWKMQ